MFTKDEVTALLDALDLHDEEAIKDDDLETDNPELCSAARKLWKLRDEH